MQEDKFAKKALQILGTAAQDGTLSDLTASLTPAPDRNKDKFLFDLVRSHSAKTLAGFSKFDSLACQTFSCWMQHCALQQAPLPRKLQHDIALKACNAACTEPARMPDCSPGPTRLICQSPVSLQRCASKDPTPAASTAAVKDRHAAKQQGAETYRGFVMRQVFDKDEDMDKKATLKLARDTKNPTAFDKDRNLGTYRTTQSMAYAPPPEVCMQLLAQMLPLLKEKAFATNCQTVSTATCTALTALSALLPCYCPSTMFDMSHNGCGAELAAFSRHWQSYLAAQAYCRSWLSVLQFHKPEYARKPIVQDTFYRRTTAFAPQGGVAVAASG